jgi:predicted permease
VRALRRFVARAVNFATRRRGDGRLQEEMREHLLQQTEENLRAGMPPAEARRQAALKLGPVEAIRESYHDEEGWPLVESLVQDVRYGVRVLRNSRGFTAVAATSLALAIGANTTIFSVAKQLLYDRLAVARAAELRLLAWTGTRDRVAVHHSFDGFDALPGGRVGSAAFSYPAYRHLRAQNRVLGDLLAFHATGMNATVGVGAQRVFAHEVSGNYYAVLGVRPQLGRGIEPPDDTAASPPVAVISDAFWAREFGRSREVLGRSIRLNDVPVTIVGVNPETFTGARSALQSETPAVVVALAMQPILTPSSDGKSLLTNPERWWVKILGRAQPDVDDATARAALDTELSAVVRATMPVRSGEELPRLALRDGSRGMFLHRDAFARPMAVLMMFVALVLLLACVNITTLLLARGAQRQREMSVRLALGAGRARILRQTLVESLLLAALGGAGGLAIGYLGRTVLPWLTGNAWRQASLPVRFDWQVFAFTSAVTVLTGVLFGLAPALAATRAGVADGMKEGSRTATRRRTGPAGRWVAGFQIALSTLLVIGAGLFMRTLAGLSAVETGFRSENLLLVQIPLPQNRYPARADVAFHQRLEEALAATPGVESVSPQMESYLTGDYSDAEFRPEGEAQEPGRNPRQAYNAVGARFFGTLGIPIVAGRAFGVGDTGTAPRVGIVNQSLARARFPNQDPIGKRFSVAGASGHVAGLADGPIEIVGVCGDTIYTNLHEPKAPQFFVPYAQLTQVRGMTYAVRTRVDPEAMVPEVRRVVSTADPALPLVNVRTQQQQIDQNLQDERLFVALTSGFGSLALILASVGIYGVMAYSVAQRTNEIGIRLALGAIPRQVLAMVLREASRLAAAGVAAGVAASLLLSRLVASMLYGIAPHDPATLAVAAAVLLTVALAASWVPARRASRVQPTVALRRD